MRLVFLAVLAVSLSGCGFLGSPKQEFWGRLQALCGQSFSGAMVSDDPEDAHFREAELGARFDDCTGGNQIDIDFMVDGAPYAHWVLTRGGETYELRHVHKEGLTGYGGFAADNSSGSRMNFPADDVTKAIFTDVAEASKANVWAMEIRSGSVFNYEMSRPGRYFMVSFDITHPKRDEN